ncbi:MAG: twin-arginine translocase subunit TatC [Planctomycetota bacterium]
MPLDQSGDLVNESDISMPLGDHLEELRMRLILCGIGIVVAAGVTFYFIFDLIAWLAQPLLQAQDTMGFPAQTLVTDATAGFTSVILPVGLIAAALLASPWIIYQGWKFISVGLYSHEKKAVYILTPFSTFMTVLAVSFTYYILLPISLLFFMQFATYFPKVELSSPNPVMKMLLDAYSGDETPKTNAGDQLTTAPPIDLPQFPVLQDDPEDAPEGSIWINARQGKLKTMVNGDIRIVGLRSDRLINPLPQLGEYVKFAAMLMFGVTLAFQLPVVMLVLGWTHLFDPKAIASLRKYALFVAFAAGAILTPTDMLSMFVLAVPLYVLFEVGLIMMKIADRSGPAAPDEL